jgi:hypothetical protein
MSNFVHPAVTPQTHHTGRPEAEVLSSFFKHIRATTKANQTIDLVTRTCFDKCVNKALFNYQSYYINPDEGRCLMRCADNVLFIQGQLMPTGLTIMETFRL